MDSAASREATDCFLALVTQRFGLQFDEGKCGFLAGILRQRMQETGQQQASLYFAFLASDAGAREWDVLAEQLTVAETYFFRNRDQFRALREAVLPALFHAKSHCRRLRILSAGCASGEEAYSIAMLIDRHFAEFAGWEIEILGVDVNPTVIAKAARGCYPAWSLRETPDEYKNHYFQMEGREYKLDKAICAAVKFETRNLAGDEPGFWPRRCFDLVCCRNVIMYFRPEVARSVVVKVGQALTPGGYLFLGHAETLRGISSDFHLCHTHETFYYKLREDAPISAAQEHLHYTEPPLAPVPLTLEADASWVNTIQHASERIASLARKPGQVQQPAIASAPVLATAGRQDLSEALSLLTQERYEAALQTMEALPPDTRQDADAQLLHAVLLTNAGQLEAADRLCQQILAMDEMNAGAHYLKALCDEHRKDRHSAVEHDHAACYLDPWFAMPHFHLGIMARRAGELETARRELSAALLLLLREDASRILLFGGGFDRDALTALCRAELHAAGGTA